MEIGVNEERTGALTDPLTSDDDPMDVWTLRGEPETALHVDMVTEQFDAVLYAVGDEIELWDDDSGGGTNARLELTLPPSGEVIIIASAFDSSSRGQYVLRTRTAAAADDEAYEHARAENTMKSYASYLRDFPNGRYVTEVLAAVTAMASTIGVNEERTGALTDPVTSDPMDVWTLRGEPGKKLHVDMVTDEFDAVLFAMGDETNLMDDDSGGGTNARLELTLPVSGEVIIIASAFDNSSRGQYVLRTRTAAAARDDDAYERARAEHTVESYSAYLMSYPDGRHQTEARGGLSAAAPKIGVNEERTGALTDALTSVDGNPMDVWTLRGEPGTELHVDMMTEEFDAYLYAWANEIELWDDDSGGGTNARLELTLPPSGQVMVIASAFESSSRGQYVLRTTTAAVAQDDEAYQRSRANHTVASYEQYLTEYPNGRHADEARRLLAEASDDEAYQRARAEDTSSAYQAYLGAYVNGRHVSDARRMLAAARSREESLPGRRFQDCDDCPLMVVVPPGSYMMGTPASARRRERDEGPQHIVTLEYPMAVGIYEVTLAEYRRFVASTSHSARTMCWRWDGKWSRYSGTWSSPGYRQTDRDPVVCVSWEDATEYVRWLSRETGEQYRLLSEAEWEYVARGGTNTTTYWGEESAEAYMADESAESQCRYANGADRTLRNKDRHQDWEWDFTFCDDGYHRTAPVGTYKENGYGLHDVLGNVWEWTQDCKSENYEGVPSDGSAWQREGCDRRAIRGGSWSDAPDDLRSGNRGWANADHRDYTLGFRVARII